jgi:hypothetical protein
MVVVALAAQLVLHTYSCKHVVHRRNAVMRQRFVRITCKRRSRIQHARPHCLRLAAIRRSRKRFHVDRIQEHACACCVAAREFWQRHVMADTGRTKASACGSDVSRDESASIPASRLTSLARASTTGAHAASITLHDPDPVAASVFPRVQQGGELAAGSRFYLEIAA